MADQTIDYDALAKQHGAISSTPPQGGIDYDALAKQHGAISSTAPPTGQQITVQRQNDTPAAYGGIAEWVGNAVREGAIGRAVEHFFPPGSPVRSLIGTPTSTVYAERENPQLKTAVLPFEAGMRPGVGRGVAGFAGGLTTPENLLLMTGTGGLGALEKQLGSSLIQRLTSAGFSANMLHGAYQQVPELRNAWNQADWPMVRETLTRMVLGTGMAGLSAKHALYGPPEAKGPTGGPPPGGPPGGPPGDWRQQLEQTDQGPPPGGPPGGPGRPLFQSTLNPVQQSAADFLESRGVPIDAGTKTGNKFLKGAQALAQSQPLGATTAMKARRATEQGLTRVSGELAEQAYPEPVTPESAGQGISKSLNATIGNLSQERDAAYEQAWKGRDDPQHTYDVPVRMTRGQEVVNEATGEGTGLYDQQPVMQPVNMPVDMRGIKMQAQPIFEEMQWMPAADQASNSAYAALKKILTGDDFIPAWQAERGLSGLKDAARVTSKSGVRDVKQGVAASLIPSLQEGIDAAVARTGEDALAGLRAGRETHAHVMGVADLVDQLRTEPVQAFGQTTWKQDTGIDFLRKINEQAPGTMPKIGRAFVQQLFDKATEEGGFGKSRTLLNRWLDLGPQTKALLFPDEALRSDLDNFFHGQAMVAENPNPSGTAVVGSLIPGAGLMITNPLAGGAWLMSGYAASKLLFTPGGVRLLTEGMNTPARSARGFAIGKAISNALGNYAKQGMRGEGPPEEPPQGPPEEPPTGGGGSEPGTPPPPPPPPGAPPGSGGGAAALQGGLERNAATVAANREKLTPKPPTTVIDNPANEFQYQTPEGIPVYRAPEAQPAQPQQTGPIPEQPEAPPPQSRFAGRPVDEAMLNELAVEQTGKQFYRLPFPLRKQIEADAQRMSAQPAGRSVVESKPVQPSPGSTGKAVLQAALEKNKAVQPSAGEVASTQQRGIPEAAPGEQIAENKAKLMGRQPPSQEVMPSQFAESRIEGGDLDLLQEIGFTHAVEDGITPDKARARFDKLIAEDDTGELSPQVPGGPTNVEIRKPTQAMWKAYEEGIKRGHRYNETGETEPQPIDVEQSGRPAIESKPVQPSPGLTGKAVLQAALEKNKAVQPSAGEVASTQQRGIPEEAATEQARVAANKAKLTGQAAPTETPAATPPAEPSTLGRVSDAMQEQADAAIERMRQRGTFKGTQMNALVPVDDLKDMAIWGAAKIAQGTVDFAKWSKEMIADAGPQIKPHLQDLFNQAQKIYGKHVDTTADQLPATKQLLKLSKLGAAGKEWYTKTRAELESMFGPDADQMVKFLAATSPNNTVAGNVSQALKAYRQWRTGQPFEGYLPLHADYLNKIAAGEKFGKLKVDSFVRNLAGETEPVTVDRWIARAFKFPTDQPTPGQYKFMDYTLTQIAKRNGLEPRQLQAMIWTAIKEADAKGATTTSLPFEELLPKKIAADPQMQILIKNAKAGEMAPARP